MVRKRTQALSTTLWCALPTKMRSMGTKIPIACTLGSQNQNSGKTTWLRHKIGKSCMKLFLWEWSSLLQNPCKTCICILAIYLSNLSKPTTPPRPKQYNKEIEWIPKSRRHHLFWQTWLDFLLWLKLDAKGQNTDKKHAGTTKRSTSHMVEPKTCLGFEVKKKSKTTN